MSAKLAIISGASVSPIIAIAVAFMAGVLSSHYLAPPSTAVLIALGLSLAGIVVSFCRRWRIVPVVLMLALWSSLGVLSYHVRYQRCARDNIVRYSCRIPVLTRLRAQVVDGSQWVASSRPWPSDPSLYLSVRVSDVHTRQGWSSASGSLRVRIKRPLRSAVRGQRLEFLGMLSRYQAPKNPGEFDWKQYKRFQGQLCRLTVENGAVLRRLEPIATSSSPGLLTKSRQHFSTVLSDEDFPAESNSLLKAMVLGERDDTFRRLNEAFQRTGLFHFLCVSGLHLGILAGFVWFVGLIVRNFAAIAGGGLHSLALTSTGSLVSWGRDQSGVVGDTPTANDFMAIAGGAMHSLALTSNGLIVSWGSDSLGQVSDTPTGNGFLGIGAGTSHSLALTADGSIVVWGPSWPLTTEVPAGNGFTSVDAGAWHGIALHSDGYLVSWGDDVAHQVTDTCRSRKLHPRIRRWESGHFRDLQIGQTAMTGDIVLPEVRL